MGNTIKEINEQFDRLNNQLECFWNYSLEEREKLAVSSLSNEYGYGILEPEHLIPLVAKKFVLPVSSLFVLWVEEFNRQC